MSALRFEGADTGLKGAAPSAPATEPLEWSFHPWRHARPGAIGGLVVGVAGFMIVLAKGLAPVTAVALGVAFLLAMSPSYVVARCRVDDGGVSRGTVLGTKRFRWSEIRRAGVTETTLFVSPNASPSWLDGFRALSLYVPAELRHALLPEIRHRLEQHDLLEQHDV